MIVGRQDRFCAQRANTPPIASAPFDLTPASAPASASALVPTRSSSRRRRSRHHREPDTWWARAGRAAIAILGVWGSRGAAAQSLAVTPSAWQPPVPPSAGSSWTTLPMPNGTLDLGRAGGIMGTVDFFHDTQQTYAGFQLFAAPWHHALELEVAGAGAEVNLTLDFVPVPDILGLLDVRDLTSPAGPERLPRCLTQLGQTYLNRMIGPISAEGWYFRQDDRAPAGVFNVSQQFNAAGPLTVEIDNSTETLSLRVATSSVATVVLTHPT